MYNRVREQFRSTGRVKEDGLPASLPLELKLYTNNKIADVSVIEMLYLQFDFNMFPEEIQRDLKKFSEEEEVPAG